MSVVSDFTCSIWIFSHRSFMNSLFHCMGRASKFFPSIVQKVAVLLKHNYWDLKKTAGSNSRSLFASCWENWIQNNRETWSTILISQRDDFVHILFGDAFFNSTVTWMHWELFLHMRHQSGKLSLNIIISILTLLIRKMVTFVQTSRNFIETNTVFWKVTFI